MKKNINLIQINPFLIILLVIVVAGTAFLTSFALHKKSASLMEQREQLLVDELSRLVDAAYDFEVTAVSSFPVYSDYASLEKEQALRTYLYPWHKKIAEAYGRKIESDEDIDTLVKEGELVPLGRDGDFYCYGVPAKYRFLDPDAKRALYLVCTTFNRKLGEKGLKLRVKLALSSCIRPAQYQDILTTKNGNAVSESTHSYGVSFDLFFDDFYVVLPEPEGDTAREMFAKVRGRYGFTLGDSLRRQFKTVLTETVRELQDQGLIYPILERKQKVYHITYTEKLAESVQ